MKKKIISAIICVCIIFAVLASCDYSTPQSNVVKDTTENDECKVTDPKEEDRDLLRFSTYDDILDSLRFMTAMYNYYKIGEAVRENYKNRYDLSTEENRAMYEVLDELVFTYYPPALGASSPPEDAFAYGIKDLDGDGVDELVLVERDRHCAFALLTKKNGKIIFGNTDYLERPHGEPSQRLSYWINTVELDLKPLFPESREFDLDAIRREAEYNFECALECMQFSKVWVPLDKDHVFLTDYKVNTDSGKKPLSEIEDIKFAFVDMNGDTVNELIIDCGELLMLHFSLASVHLHPLSADQAYRINTDGSFAWEKDHEFGESRITYWNGNGYYRTEVLFKIVNEGEPNAEYYIGEDKVEKSELLKYLEENKKTEVEFLTLNELWEDMLSPNGAIEIANEYWKERIDKEGLAATIAFRSMNFPKVPETVHVVHLVKYNRYHNPTLIEEIWIDKGTGAIKLPFEVDS